MYLKRGVSGYLDSSPVLNFPADNIFLTGLLPAGDFTIDLTEIWDTSTGLVSAKQLPRANCFALCRFWSRLVANNAPGEREQTLYFYFDAARAKHYDFAIKDIREQVALANGSILLEDHFVMWIPVIWTGAALIAYGRRLINMGVGHTIVNTNLLAWREDATQV